MRHHIRMLYDAAASAERIFEILATGENQAQWANGYVRTEWVTPEHASVGAVRDIHLKHFIVRERFLAWEPGHRFAFSADAMRPRIAGQMIEDIRILPTTGGASRLDWTVHVSLGPGLAPFGDVLIRRIFRPMFEAFASGLAAYASAHPDASTPSAPSHVYTEGTR